VWARSLVVYLEDRNGRALVRLPNGSKTSLPYDSVDFVVSNDGLERPVSGDDLTRGPLLDRIAAAPTKADSLSAGAGGSRPALIACSLRVRKSTSLSSWWT
jgi:hypothetical protein